MADIYFDVHWAERRLYLCCSQGISPERVKTIYSRKMKEAECEELDCHNARFGFALANANDVDGDGYAGKISRLFIY